MATDSNLILTGSTPKDILIGTSTSFIVQNLSDKRIHYKIKDSASGGGLLEPLEPYAFNYNITVWQDSSIPDTNANLYVVRG